MLPLDILAFAQAAGVATIQDLATTHVHFHAKCSNGEKMAFNSYLRRAAVVFKMAKTTHEAGNFNRPTLNKLLEVAS